MSLAECTGFTHDAWKARLKEQEDRVRAAGPLVAKAFGDSEARWAAWNKEDCAMQIGEEGGNYNAEQSNICLFTHSAQRALELEALADWWEGHPPSAPEAR